MVCFDLRIDVGCTGIPALVRPGKPNTHHTRQYAAQLLTPTRRTRAQGGSQSITIPETPCQTAQTDAATSFKPEALLPPEWSTAISGYKTL